MVEVGDAACGRLEVSHAWGWRCRMLEY